MSGEHPFETIASALRVAVPALRDAKIPFVLGGSFAAWVRGGPRPYNDLDLMIKPADAERALRELGAAGMRTERPPEEWLLKAWHGEVLIDLIFNPAGLEMTDDVFARADMLPVFAIATPVMSLPSTRMRPWFGRSKPATRRSAVVLPQPDGPSMA